MIGALLAVVSALTFALNSATSRRGVLTGSVAQGMAITVPLGTLIFLITAAAVGYLPALAEFPVTSLAYFSAAGILHFVLGRYCNLRATKAMGAVLVGTIVEAGLVWTILLAVIALGEPLTPLRILGIALIVYGPTLALRKGRASPVKDKPAEFQPNYLEGTIFAVLCALAFGTSPILVRAAMPGDAGIAGGLLGGLISYAAATVVTSMVLLWPGQLRHVMASDRTATNWFAASGVLLCISQMARYMALAIAPVTIVTPIQRTAIIFRLIFSRLINPRHEVFGRGVILASLICMLGVAALTLNGDAVVTRIPLPAQFAHILTMEWRPAQ